MTAATNRFSRESYDDVGMRDIAGDVGVDAALISRYFGSKEDLFIAVLNASGDKTQLIEGDRSDFGQRMAQEAIFKERDEGKLEHMLIMLRSIGSTKAAELVQRNGQTCFFGPFEEWLGGPDAAVRARLAAGIMMGVSIGSELCMDDLTEDQCRDMHGRMAVILQQLVDG
ncbi:TetR family transcriptional regulator [Brevundimonas sp.]